MSRMVSFVVLVAILIVIGILFFQVMSGFLVPLFLAALLVVVFQPLFRWTLARCHSRRYAAAGITTLLVLLIVLIPAGLVVTLATVQGLSIVEELQVTDIRGKLRGLREQLSLDIPAREDLDRIEETLKRWKNEEAAVGTPQVNPEMVDNLQLRLDKFEKSEQDGKNSESAALAHQLRDSLNDLRDSQPYSIERDEALESAQVEFLSLKRDLLGGSTLAWVKELVNPTDEQIATLRNSLTSTIGSPLLTYGGGTLVVAGKWLFGLIIIVAGVFFLFAEGSRMLDAAVRLSPLEERYVRELAGEFDRVCRAVVSATLLSAVAQGVLAGIGYLVVGMHESAALLVLLTMVLALVPFTGAAAVWVPVSLYLYFVEGRLAAASGLAVYGAVVVSGADNVIKPMVLHGQSNLHPLLALLSVIGGIQALGPIGILVGPMVVVFLQTLLKILQRELLSLDRGEGEGFQFPFFRIGPTATSSSSTTDAAAASEPAPAHGNNHSGQNAEVAPTKGPPPAKTGKKGGRK